MTFDNSQIQDHRNERTLEMVCGYVNVLSVSSLIRILNTYQCFPRRVLLKSSHFTFERYLKLFDCTHGC